MLNTIKFIGRLSVLFLAVIFLEGMFTIGYAFQFENYGAIECIIQAFVFCTTIWGATEWHESEK